MGVSSSNVESMLQQDEVGVIDVSGVNGSNHQMKRVAISTHKKDDRTLSEF